MFDDNTPVGRREFLVNRALLIDADFAKALFLDSIDWDIRYARSTLQQMAVPGLVVQATSFDYEFRWRSLSEGQSTDLIDTMREVVADFQAVIVKNADHFVMDDNPDAVAESIANFARRFSTEGSAT